MLSKMEKTLNKKRDTFVDNDGNNSSIHCFHKIVEQWLQKHQVT